MTALKSFEARLHAIMAGNDEGRWPYTRAILRAVSFAYGLAGRTRVALYRRHLLPRRRLPCKVVAIGNLTAGGTGKTPMTISLARMIRQMGKTVVVLSRGYRGGAEKCGGVVSDGRTVCMSPTQAGDEPYLMATRLEGIPVIVGRDRLRSGMLAVKRFRPDVIILDDAYQHLKLQRDVDLLLLDCRHPFGNGHLLPRGPLREPREALFRSDAIVLTRCGDGKPDYYEELVRSAQPRGVFCARHDPAIRFAVPAGDKMEGWWRQPAGKDDRASLAGRRVCLFSGLARNDTFRDTLGQLGGLVAATFSFGDHYQYTPHDLQQISDAACAARCEVIATTEKDFVRLPAQTSLALDLVVIGVDLALDRSDRQRWRQWVSRVIGA